MAPLDCSICGAMEHDIVLCGSISDQGIYLEAAGDHAMIGTSSIDEGIGPWCAQYIDQESNTSTHCIAIVKDLNAFRDAFQAIKSKSGKKALREQIAAIIDLIEFGTVKVSKSGTVKWQSGQFVVPD